MLHNTTTLPAWTQSRSFWNPICISLQQSTAATLCSNALQQHTATTICNTPCRVSSLLLQCVVAVYCCRVLLQSVAAVFCCSVMQIGFQNSLSRDAKILRVWMQSLSFRNPSCTTLKQTATEHCNKTLQQHTATTHYNKSRDEDFAGINAVALVLNC